MKAKHSGCMFLFITLLSTLSGCGVMLPSQIASSDKDRVVVQFGVDSEALELAIKECKKFGNGSAVLQNKYDGEIPQYFYRCTRAKPAL